MAMNFSEERYEEMLGKLFVRFPSFQKAGAAAYKPGLDNMLFFDSLAGHPHHKYSIIHVAGTNGKGSVSNMLASVLAAAGFKVGLYTSPHILDFRERMRVVDNVGVRMVSKEYIWDFVNRWQDTFDHLDMSFFEITTVMALSWFAESEADWVVLETGLGGRLDSTNIVTPVLSVITNIGLDHCDLLGETLPEIAFEKAGIIKPEVPVVVGESNPETDPVFERKVLYTNISEPSFMGSRTAVMSLLTFADKTIPGLWERHEDILVRMDLQGQYQRFNLRTVLTALDVLRQHGLAGQQLSELPASSIEDAIAATASCTGFRGRWEKLSDSPLTICDIGHNEHGLRHNFAQLEQMLVSGRYTDLVVVYGSVADKDVDSVIHLFPQNAVYVFTQADSRRALPAEIIKEKYIARCVDSGQEPCECHCVPSVIEAVAFARKRAMSMTKPLIYIGGSTYVVSEACAEEM